MIFFLRSILEVYIDFFSSNLPTAGMVETFFGFTARDQVPTIRFLSTLGDDFVKVVKFYTAYPFAVFLNQDDKPPRPSVIAEERVWLWEGNMRKFLKRVSNFRQPAYAPLYWGVLQGVKRGCASVPETFISRAYADHLLTMTRTSRITVLQDRITELRNLLEGSAHSLPTWGDENQRVEELMLEIKSLEDETGVTETRDKTSRIFDPLVSLRDPRRRYSLPYQSLTLTEFDAFDRSYEPSSSASFERQGHLGGQRTEVMEELMHPPEPLQNASWLQAPADNVTPNLEDNISLDLVTKLSDLRDYQHNGVTFSFIFHRGYYARSSDEYYSDWLSGRSTTMSIWERTFSLKQVLRPYQAQNKDVLLQDFTYRHHTEAPVVPTLLETFPEDVASIISSYLGANEYSVELKDVQDKRRLELDNLNLSESIRLAERLSHISNGVTYEDFGSTDLEVGLQKMFETKPGLTHSIRGYLPDYLNRTTPRRYLLERYNPSPIINANVIALSEPLKVRVITTGEAVPYYLSKPLQRAFWNHLFQFPQFVLTGQPLTVEILDDLWLQTVTFCDSHSIQPFDSWVSGDYKGATDTLDIQSTMAAMSSGINTIKKTSDMSPLMEELLDINRAVLDAHDLVYPAETQHYLPASDILRLIEEGSLAPPRNGQALVAHQGTGQLMGSPLSFPILCIINFVAYWSSIEEYLGKSISDFTTLPVRINGDDILFMSNTAHYAIWKKHIARHSFQLSLGKNYIHPRYLTVNSILFHYTRHEDAPSDFEEINYFNVGLLLGQSKGVDRNPDRRLPFAELYRISVGNACDQRRAHDRFIHYNLKQIRDFTGNGKYNLFIPIHLGGLGFPLFKSIKEWKVPGPDGQMVYKIHFTPFQVQFATFLSLRVKQVSAEGEIPYKYFSALVPMDLVSYYRLANFERKKMKKEELIPPPGAQSPTTYYRWKGNRPLYPLLVSKDSGFSETLVKRISYIEPSLIKRSHLSYHYDAVYPLVYRLPTKSIMSEFHSYFKTGRKTDFALEEIDVQRLMSNEPSPVYVDRDEIFNLFTASNESLGFANHKDFHLFAELNELPESRIESF
nr:MAG: hypothetical protein [Crogonang virus 48]